MVSIIKDPAADEAVCSLAKDTGESITEVIRIAVSERAQRCTGTICALKLGVSLLIAQPQLGRLKLHKKRMELALWVSLRKVR